MTVVPKTPMETGVQEGMDGPWDSHPPNLTTRQRQGKLFEELDLSRLNSWPVLAGFWPSTTMSFH